MNKKENACPVCCTIGQPVENVTVRHLVKKELMLSVDDNSYWLCLDEDCDVAYYTETKAMFRKDDLKVPLWFKRDADPKYACYCNEITEEQVIETVVNTGIDSMKDIINAIKSKANAQCRVRNPAGKCCTKAFNEAIEKGKDIRDN
ncbi:hypothetical protein LI82_00360 [Methanococcoides methylutens]|uniref:CopZ zinc binding domain-containing protein n=1 Tax=Methanococcoides methylutens TaxID=2226 RepID=A0A099T3R7_METMT|nr:hypothetical protein LI82_00360 [Methanococcoides methylutens]